MWSSERIYSFQFQWFNQWPVLKNFPPFSLRCFRFSFSSFLFLVCMSRVTFLIYSTCVCVCSCVFVRIQFHTVLYVSNVITFESCVPWHSIISIFFRKEYVEEVERKKAKAELVDKMEFPCWPKPTNAVASQIYSMFYDFTYKMQRCSLSLLAAHLMVPKSV